MARMTGQIQGMGAEGTPPLPDFSPFNLRSIQVNGGSVQHGLGWCILALGAAAALLPYFARRLDAATCKAVGLLGLTIGAFLLVYLATQYLRFVRIGIVLGLMGYALEILALLKERRGT
jgi:peptidoglycan/LPS O-acetylase OafA/YrhL